jgi:hypothetical protein
MRRRRRKKINIDFLFGSFCCVKCRKWPRECLAVPRLIRAGPRPVDPPGRPVILRVLKTHILFLANCRAGGPF